MARRKSHRTLLAFLVLNLLTEAPMHPYEMKRLIRWRGKDELLGVNLDSLYHAIGQLERAALIEPVETSRQGGRPERTVYRVTPAGKDELHDWMRDLMSEPTIEFPRFIAALAHLASIQPAECLELLQRREMLLEMQIARLDVGMRTAEGQLPRVFVVEGEYALVLQRAELDWVRSLIEDLGSGRLTWDQEEIRRLSVAEPAASEEPPMA
jgi:DNA-binding PadR family transcriptional regulator